MRNGKVYMLYRAQDNIGKPAGTSRIGLATSKDGMHFMRFHQPVLFPEEDEEKKYEWEGGCEDPRVVEDESGNYFMTYTAFDGTTARLMVAFSKDLEHWDKKGPAFADAYAGKYLDKWSKSGSIVSRYDKGKIIATKVNGKYWMYWGDQNIWAATSDDLVNWTLCGNRINGDSTSQIKRPVANHNARPENCFFAQRWPFRQRPGRIRSARHAHIQGYPALVQWKKHKG